MTNSLISQPTVGHFVNACKCTLLLVQSNESSAGHLRYTSPMEYGS